MSQGQQTAQFALGGGLDLVTAAIAAKAGTVRASLNYESTTTGYRRMDGFNRFDGRPSPADASWFLLNFDAGVGQINLGDTVTGLTSGATGKALANATLSSGTYGGSNGVGYVALGNVTGTFLDNEALRVGGVTKATLNGIATEGDSYTDAEAVAWVSQARTNARALIAAIPGSGPVRGVHKYNGILYAFRDNVGATFGTMWKATVLGWTQITFGKLLSFTSGGVYVLKDGDVITGATSGASATVTRVVLDGTGSFVGGGQTGYLILSGQTGNFVGENLNVGANLDVATIAGNSTQISLPAGGLYNCITSNFYGTASFSRMYFANGVGFAHEFDGINLIPIKTGMATDTPSYIGEHKNALLLTFPGGSLQASKVGGPIDWRGQLGAVEIGLGSEIVGLLEQAQGTTIILCESKIAYLTGSDSNDYQIVSLSDEAGAIPHSASRMLTPIYMDARGIRSIGATQEFGNFRVGTITAPAAGLIQNYVKRGAKPVAALRVRAKDQYRLFFDDASGLTIYFGKKTPETLQFQLPMQVRCATSYESSGAEELFVGCDDGFVYQLDSGYSFDGAVVPYFLRLPYNHLGAPRILKRWHEAVIEVDTDGPTSLFVQADFDYGESEDGIDPQNFSLPGNGGLWNIDNWNEFYWSAPLDSEAMVSLDGVSKNISLLFAGEAADEPPHLLQGVTIYYTVRGLQRG